MMSATRLGGAWSRVRRIDLAAGVVTTVAGVRDEGNGVVLGPLPGRLDFPWPSPSWRAGSAWSLPTRVPAGRAVLTSYVTLQEERSAPKHVGRRFQ
jgi:hypothetical protein